MNWRLTKSKIGSRLNSFLSEFEFERRCKNFEWVRYVNDVCQIVIVEKMVGSHIRIRVFVLSADEKPIGGNLTRSAIEGSTSLDGDYFWSVAEGDMVDSLVHIEQVVRRIAMPWFATICTADRLRNARREYRTSNYELDDDYFPPTHPPINIGDENRFWTQVEIKQLIDDHLLEALISWGFKDSNDDLIYTRQRNEITDVVEILSLNNGVHLACRVYNWISDLSATGQKEFSSDSRVILVGGVLAENGIASGVPVIYTLHTESAAEEALHELQILLKTAVSEISLIDTKLDFIRAVKAEHRATLKAFGLSEK